MEPLTFTVQQNGAAVTLPPAAFTLSGLDGEGHYELRTGADVLVVLKPRMTAMELIRAADDLHEFSAELHAHLAGVCGPCDDCERCPYDDPAPEEISLSCALRAEAGIRENRKLCAEVDKEAGCIIISDAGYDHDLRDVPEDVREMFVCAGISLCDLDQRLREGEESEMSQMNDMEINVKIRHRNESGPTLAYASVVLGGCFVIREVRVVEGKNGLFTAMPSRKAGDKYEDICFPCTKELHQRINDAVLEAYREEQEDGA